jgi:hypothetical protein
LNLPLILKRTRRSGIGFTTASFAMIILIVAGGIGVASTMQPGPKLGAERGSTSTAIVSSPDGLQLAVSSNASELQVGQRLNVSLSIVNTLPKVNIVKPSHDWLFQGVPVALWPPCYFGLPAEAAVLQGNYNAQDIERAANVTFSYICMEGVNVDHVIFQPNSDQVNLTGLYDVTSENQTLGPFHMSLSFVTGGYWNLQNLSSELNIPILGEQYPPRPPAYIPFTPGEYTVAVADEWGQVALLHFSVSQSEPVAAGLLIRVVNGSSGQPVAGVRALAGPASSADDMALTPGGPTLKECVHGVPSGSDVLGNGTVVLPNGTHVTYPTCPLKTYTTNSSGLVSIPESEGEYYFFSVGGMLMPSFVYGIVRLSGVGETYVTVTWPNGNYTVAS